MKTSVAFLSGAAIAGLFFVASAFGPNSPNGGYSDVQMVRAPKLPERLTFAGEEVPIDRHEVRERVDRELLTFIYGHASTLHAMKLAGRYFPIIEPILARNGVPDDFKYLAVIESGLRTNALSTAGAKGFWQFMPATALEYNLEVNDEIDERQDIEKSTEAACKYLLAAKARCGSWACAAAAYNMGPGRVASSAKDQLSTNYYDWVLNNETSRYVPRVVACKELMANPEKYGIYLEDDVKYPVLDDFYVMQVEDAVPSWAEYAAKYGVSYSTFKFYNPWIVGWKLTNKSKKMYKVLIPKNQK